jgi:eukaryotic-like serine/threonine-protein kinase
MQFRELTDRYQLQKILKSTRFGTVLRATEVPSGRTVVVKLVTIGSAPGLPAGAAELEKLATALAELGHPNLPTVLDSGFTTDGSAFLVLELLEGKGLDSLAGVPPARVLSLVGQALNGLEALAGRGLAHGNVSPDNVFAVSAPGGERAVLLGLGTALFRLREPASATAENARFRAPELAAGGSADWRADVYSLTLTACHAVGATVGVGESPVVQLPFAVSFELESDEALRQALERALRQRPSERPTAGEFREALRLAVGDAAAAFVPGPRLAFEAPAEPVEEGAAEGEVLSAVDDEILNALLAVPPPPPRPVAPAADSGQLAKVVPFLKKAPVAAPAQQRTAPAGGIPFFRRPAVLGAIAGAVVLGVLAAFWLLRRPQPEIVAAPAPPPAAFAKLPSRPPTDRLEEARLHLAQGEDLKARRLLRSISYGEQGLLSPQGCRELSAIEETLALAALVRLPSDLAGGLRAGNLEVLQAAVEAGAGEDAGLAPPVRADLDRARGIVETYGQAGAAATRGENVRVLERFADLLSLLPKATDPEDLRGKAALALETQGEALVQGARYAEALTRLAPILRTWPDRPGLSDRIARYQTYQREEKEQEALLAALPSLERRKRPWDGLQMLNGVEPTPHLASAIAAARARLEALLARLDQEPPQIVLRDGYLLEYARGTVAELSFRASDDYEVKDVKLTARAEGGRFRDLPLEKTRAGYYTVAIAPGFHQNGTVELFVVATDLSGHEAAFGSRDKPLQLNRKQGFERLIR